MLSLNDDLLRKLYKKKAAEGKGNHKFKPNASDWMLIEDCVQLLREDCGLNISLRKISMAFGMSKKEVDKEFEKDSLMTYNKLTYVEFLEFLVRTAELYFEESEMQELELHEKLEYLLDELLPVVDSRRIKHAIVIEEFSESDDDY